MVQLRYLLIAFATFVISSSSSSAQTLLDGSFESCTNNISADANTIQSVVLSGCTTDFAMFGNGLDQSFFSDGTQFVSYGTIGCFFQSPAPTNGNNNIGISAGATIALKLSADLVPYSCYMVTFDVTNAAGDDGSGSCLGNLPAKFSFGVSSSPTSYGVNVTTMTDNIAPSNAPTLGQTVSFVAPAGNNNYLTIQMADQTNTTSILFIDNVSLAQVPCSPMPIQIGYFTAGRKDYKALLEWATYSETNNKGFSIEHSTNGSIWSSLGFINSKAVHGNSSIKLSYTFTDHTPEDGINYYRLKQIDFDGKSAYSPVRVISFDNANSISIYPNPAKDNIVVSGLYGGEVIELYDISGRVIYHAKADNNNMNISLNNLATGIYYIKTISIEGVISAYKIVKK